MSPFPFDRIDASEAAKLTSEEALERFQRLGYLWLCLPPRPTSESKSKSNSNSKSTSESTLSVLRKIYDESPESFDRKWSVENAGKIANETDLSPAVVLGGGGALLDNSSSSSSSTLLDRFYVSAIVSRGRNNQKDKTCFEQLEESLLKPYFKDVDGGSSRMTPSQLGNSQHQGGAWLFLGRNKGESKNVNNNAEERVTKKQKRNAINTKGREPQPLVGRAEHVDQVLHSGTWHVQLSGSKTWYLRPNPEADDWKDEAITDGIPDLRQYLDRTKSKSAAAAAHDDDVVQVQQSEKRGQVRLRCQVGEGDLFILNTKAWYHRTELPVDQESWSISIARDFNVPIPPIYCPEDIGEGEVILEEEDIPERFPTTTIERPEEEANCALAEVSLEQGVEEGPDNDTGDSEEQEAETSIVLVALRDVKKGESLVLQRRDDDADENSEGDDEEEENAPESIDPRAIAKQDWGEGSIVLSGDEIPEDLPLSLGPNCQIIEEEGGGMAIQALRPIAQGEVFAIAPGDEDNLEEFEEIEIDLENGQMLRNKA